MEDEPVAWKIARLRGEILELARVVRQLHRVGLDNATAQLLLWRKTAELESVLKRCRSTGSNQKADHIR